MIAQQRISSAILWGPPGVGKTTITRLLADAGDLAFEPVSATFSGVADLRKVFAAARSRRGIGQGTLLFVDEIHRFNRAQQDSFLHYVEDGTVTLIGATCPRSSTAPNNSRPSRTPRHPWTPPRWPTTSSSAPRCTTRHRRATTT